VIYVERRARGGLVEWTILDADGEPVEPWCEAPPRSAAES
jgi:hypothetical protein